MTDILELYKTVALEEVSTWVKVGKVSDFPDNAGACIKHEGKQIAVFNFVRLGKWYACQNVCPHKFEMVMSRGMIGDEKGEPKVACPLHKNNFSLEDGKHINGDMPSLTTYPVKIENEEVFVGF